MKAMKTRFTFTDATSDKEYIVVLEGAGDSWMVNCHYGRRGGTLAVARKTPVPVAYEVARAAYDKEYKARLKKGYTPDGEPQTIVTNGDGQTVMVEMLPQLLNEVDDAKLEKLFVDDLWVMQEKQDGHRRSFMLDADQTISANRKGFSVPYPQEVVFGLSTLAAFFPLMVDGELMGDTYAIFDVRTFEGVNIEMRPLEARLAIMDTLAQALDDAGVCNVFVVKTAHATEEKRKLFSQIQEGGFEGVVFKQKNTPYVSGRPASGGGQLKFKFVQDATCIVTSHHATKRSVGIGLLDENGVLVDVGNCTIPPNKTVPDIEALIDVRYLYAFKGGSLFQPRFLVVRDDIVRQDCTTMRLKYKAEISEDDSESMVA